MAVAAAPVPVMSPGAGDAERRTGVVDARITDDDAVDVAVFVDGGVGRGAGAIAVDGDQRRREVVAAAGGDAAANQAAGGGGSQQRLVDGDVEPVGVDDRAAGVDVGIVVSLQEGGGVVVRARRLPSACRR